MLFTNLNESFEKKDSSLKQGSNFNGMQHRIITEAMPKFQLIEKTSMPNITYMKEPLANMEKKEQKQKQQKSLSQIDKEEFKKLNELEAKFSKKLSEYVTIYKSRSGEVMKPEKCVSINKVPDATSCHGWNCNVDHQFCPKGAPGASTSNYLCSSVDDNLKWVSVNTKPGSQCSTLSESAECNSQFGIANGDCTMVKTNVNTTNVNASDAKLKLLNEQLMSLSREMWTQTQNIQGKDLKLQKQIAKKREKLNKNIKKLAAHQTNFNKLNESRTTLAGQLEDTSLKSNTEYMHYMAWFVAATTIGAIAIQRLLK